jgi:hypothetical protein
MPTLMEISSSSSDALDDAANDEVEAPAKLGSQA